MSIIFRVTPHNSVPTPMVNEKTPAYKWNAMDCTAGNPLQCEGLGYEGKV